MMNFFFLCRFLPLPSSECAFPSRTIRSFIVLSNEIRFDEERNLRNFYLAVLGIYAW